MTQLKELNDERLGALIDTADDAARTETLESILVQMRPVVRRVLRHAGSQLLRAEDFEDIESAVNLRLYRRLELTRLYESEAIRSLNEFVATLTYNAVYDFLRRRFPERTRLKSRLRYLFTHEKRLALWQGERGLSCGRAEWRDRPATGPHEPVTPHNASSVMRNRNAPADAVLAIFAAVKVPLLFEDVVDLMAGLWGIADAERAGGAELVSEAPPPLDALESRQYLTSLWSEIRELRPPQRAALLLNLRDDDGSNALAHLVAAHIATLDDVAAAVGMTREELAAVWDRLPIDDSAIGTILYLTRQQVINLRKSARERLARRMQR
jgi:hypothetical protein